MHRRFPVVLALLAVPIALPMSGSARKTSPGAPPNVPAESRTVVHLWPGGAPGFEQRKDIPELAASYWVKNVNNPSLTVFLPPKEKANGAAVILCPAGGFRELGFVPEGIQAAQYFNSIGVAAFALKYRLPLETHYNQELAAAPGGLDGRQQPARPRRAREECQITNVSRLPKKITLLQRRLSGVRGLRSRK